MLSSQTIARYQPPSGDLWQAYVSRYGSNGALIIAQAAQTGDPTIVTDAISRVKYGERLDDSTFSILWQQLSTDPLAAPLETLQNTFDRIVSNPLVKTAAIFGAVGLVGYLFYKITR